MEVQKDVEKTFGCQLDGGVASAYRVGYISGGGQDCVLACDGGMANPGYRKNVR